MKRNPVGIVVIVTIVALFWSIGVGADNKPAATYAIPYRLTLTKHVMVRVKVNGQGPYNLVIDTGAPAVIFAKKLAEPLGIAPGEGGWATLDTLDVEGGLQRKSVTARFEDLFQLEGMNGLGLAGTEIHGLLGYPILARYRIEYDLTKTKLTWTEVDGKLNELPRKAGRGAPSGLNALGSMMKGFGKLIGAGPPVPPRPSGFFGMSVKDEGDQVVVAEVLAEGPADQAGLRVGDVVTGIDGVKSKTAAEAIKQLQQVEAGKNVKLAIRRLVENIEITAGRGF